MWLNLQGVVRMPVTYGVKKHAAITYPVLINIDALASIRGYGNNKNFSILEFKHRGDSVTVATPFDKLQKAIQQVTLHSVQQVLKS